MEKVCIKCKLKKDLEKFCKNKNNKDGFSSVCKECEKKRAERYRISQYEYHKIWNKNNPEKLKKYQNTYLEKNPHMTRSARNKRYLENEEFREKERIRRKQWYIKNIDRERKKSQKYYHENKQLCRKKHNEWRKNKMKSDPFFRMKKNLRDRIRSFLKGELLSKRTKDIIGLEMNEFRKYIESKFTDGMTWENYGMWHLDHKKPLYLGTNNKEILELNYYTNLQPLWAEENIQKNRKYGN
jgi:hypothetical protein